MFVVLIFLFFFLTLRTGLSLTLFPIHPSTVCQERGKIPFCPLTATYFLNHPIIGKNLKLNLIKIWSWLANGHISGKRHSWAQWMRESREEWLFLDLSLLSRNMDRDKWAHNNWFLIAQNQKNGMLLVAASEDGIRDQNGKLFTPPHLTSSTSTIITTK